MRVLAIGGTGFIGSFVVKILVEQGHEVTVFHRGSSDAKLPPQVTHFTGNRNELFRHTARFEKVAPDVVVDCILSSGRQAEELMLTCRGIAKRVVALSSQDVYRAHGILHGFDEGPVQAMPITEESDLRTRLQPYAPALLSALRQSLAWLDDEYDKIPVERAILGDEDLPGTVLRLPMVYGPGDPLHRLFPLLKRMQDGRPAILIEEGAAAWRGPRGYVENIAAAIALAITTPRAASQIYNVGEPEALSEKEWAESVGRAAGWTGRVLPLATDRTPQHLRVPYRTDQHWVVSTQKIREDLGFVEPVAFETALSRSVAWERAHPPAQFDSAQFDYAIEDSILAEVRHIAS